MPNFLSSSSSSFLAESLVGRVADAEAKATLPPVWFSNRVVVPVDVVADGLVLSPVETVSTRTESEEGLVSEEGHGTKTIKK